MNMLSERLENGDACSWESRTAARPAQPRGILYRCFRDASFHTPSCGDAVRAPYLAPG
jgi:hypothetical protein